MTDDAHLTLPDPPASLAGRLARGGAVAWSEPVTMRTYAVGEPDRYPLFVDRRVYQGSSGRVYPIPFIDHVAKDASPRQWQAVHLENRWIRLMVLPELGGRIHVGYDKVADYDFFYRNNVIKPALVGLAGPWVSGGVELNWPQHHRPATYLPVQTHVEEHPDGSVTVWCSDHDPFTRMKGMHGVRLHPDRAVVELVVRLHNRTDETQTFLWWANAAARVHDDYQSFFPTDVRYVADHARRAITAFPEADRTYYGYDYPAHHADGGDRIDFYKNIKVPTSYMVTGTRDDFFGGYDHAAGAGFVHVADRHVAPGKKQWTWGNAPFGQAWDRLLTDEDGPYVELMAGVYTDNQPDFAWLEPGETKTFRQFWYPFQGIGPVHQADTETAVRLDVGDGVATLGLVTTRPRTAVRVTLEVGGAVLRDDVLDVGPGAPATLSAAVGPRVARPDVRVVVRHEGDVLLDWTPRRDEVGPEPEVATAPPRPEAVESVDELYLTGVHLAQYRHPTWSPLPYWREGLRRDPGDARCNLALADDAYRRGSYPAAELHLRRALDRLTRRNANPRDGETSYLLGLVLARTGRIDEAIDALSKAAWDGRWSAASHVQLARLAAAQARHDDARRHAQGALQAAPDDSRASVLLAVAARNLGEDMGDVLAELLRRDPLDHAARWLTGQLADDIDARTAIDIALDLAAAGDQRSALELLERAGRTAATAAGEARPMAHYHRARLLDDLGRARDAAGARRDARTAPHDLCFPCGLDDHDALVAALEADPSDDRARELLAMLLLDAGRPDEALDLWEAVVTRHDVGTVALRNAAIAVYTVRGDSARGLALYDRAMAVAPDARLVLERDQLLARAGAPDAERLRYLDEYRDLVMTRDDVTVEYVDLLTTAGRLDEAARIMASRAFAPWEGGEGRVLAAWESLQLALSRRFERSGDLGAALQAARAAVDVPASLGEGRHELADTTAVLGRLAELLERTGREDEARVARASIRASTVVSPIAQDGTVDYFATSLPDLLLFPPRDVGRGSPPRDHEPSVPLTS